MRRAGAVRVPRRACVTGAQCVCGDRPAGGYVRASAGLELPAPPGVFGRLCARVVGVGRRVWIRIRRKSCGHGCAVPSGASALTHGNLSTVQTRGGVDRRSLLRGRGTETASMGSSLSIDEYPPSVRATGRPEWRPGRVRQLESTPGCDRRQSGDGPASALRLVPKTHNPPFTAWLKARSQPVEGEPRDKTALRPRA